MKKVLIITTHFAPDIHVGAKRMTKFAKHLPEYCWQPIIITKEIGEYHGVDETLLQELPNDSFIYRISEWQHFRSQARHATVSGGVSLDRGNNKVNVLRTYLMRVLKYFLFYDYSWLIPAFFAARRLIQQESIRIIYSSAPNFEAHLVALLLKLTTSVKWVCEFRDPWTTLHPYYHISAIQRNIDKYLERVVLRYSDHIISVGQMLKEELMKLGNLCQNKISVIYNGYDKDDFVDSFPLAVARENKCVITYTGTWGPGRSPECFLRALSRLLQNSPDIRDDLRVNFIGEFKYTPELEDKVMQYIKQANLNDVVSFVPWLPYRESLARLLSSDILLLVERPESSTNNNFWVVTSKIFLYLYARKPILALIPAGGEAAKIIREANAGEVVSPTDIEAIASKVLEMYESFKRGELVSHVKLSEIGKYERKMQTGELATIFNNLVANIEAKKKMFTQKYN